MWYNAFPREARKRPLASPAGRWLWMLLIATLSYTRDQSSLIHKISNQTTAAAQCTKIRASRISGIFFREKTKAAPCFEIVDQDFSRRALAMLRAAQPTTSAGRPHGGVRHLSARNKDTLGPSVYNSAIRKYEMREMDAMNVLTKICGLRRCALLRKTQKKQTAKCDKLIS